MLAQDRYKRITEILGAENSVKTSRLMKLFDVSLETVRRDLEHLESEGSLRRVHGGAVLDRIDGRQTTWRAREREFLPQKRELAEIACRYVHEGQSLALDGSTTNNVLAELLRERFHRLTILTNSLPILNILAEQPDYTIIIPGGIYRREEGSIIGDMTEETLLRFHVDTTFLSTSGISLREGITDFGFGEVAAKRTMMRIAQESIVLADNSKFDTVSLLKVCSIEDVGLIITDAGLKEIILKKYTDHGVEVVNR